MNKNIFVMLFLGIGCFVQATLQERLIAQNETINIMKQNVRVGKPIQTKDECKADNCKFKCKK